MKGKGKNPILPISVGVAALFLTGFLLLVAFGARSYRDVVDAQYGNMDQRALTAYLAAALKANDAPGALSLEEGEYGQMLVVHDAHSDYVLRYYLYEGELVEDFARVGAPLAPGEAQPIAPTRVFSVERGENGLVAVTTDAGRTLLCLPGGEEAAP